LQHALKYGPDLAETQLALGSFHYFVDRDAQAAETAARRAVALDPNSAMCHMFLGLMLAEQDQYVEARAMLRRARELDPLFPLMFANSAVVSLRANEPREAIEFATQAIAINPEFWVGYLHLGTAKQRIGDYEGAIQAFADAEKYSGNNSARASAARAQTLVKVDRSDEAREILDDLISRSADQNIPPYYIAVIYAALGEVDLALEWLQRGLGANGIFCLDARNDPDLASIRSDVRFESLMRRCERENKRELDHVSQ
jgi:tetratricopeptide (TPR) repeat protein